MKGDSFYPSASATFLPQEVPRGQWVPKEELHERARLACQALGNYRCVESSTSGVFGW